MSLYTPCAKHLHCSISKHFFLNVHIHRPRIVVLFEFIQIFEEKSVSNPLVVHIRLIECVYQPNMLYMFEPPQSLSLELPLKNSFSPTLCLISQFLSLTSQMTLNFTLEQFTHLATFFFSFFPGYAFTNDRCHYHSFVQLPPDIQFYILTVHNIFVASKVLSISLSLIFTLLYELQTSLKITAHTLGTTHKVLDVPIRLTFNLRVASSLHSIIPMLFSEFTRDLFFMHKLNMINLIPIFFFFVPLICMYNT